MSLKGTLPFVDIKKGSVVRENIGLDHVSAVKSEGTSLRVHDAESAGAKHHRIFDQSVAVHETHVLNDIETADTDAAGLNVRDHVAIAVIDKIDRGAAKAPCVSIVRTGRRPRRQ